MLVKEFLLSEEWELFNVRVSEIRVKQFHFNQGLGVCAECQRKNSAYHKFGKDDLCHGNVNYFFGIVKILDFEDADFLIIDWSKSEGAKGDIHQIYGCVHPLHPF